MLETILDHLALLDDILWGYVAVPAIILLGLYLTIKSRFVQIRRLPYICKHFFQLIFHKSSNTQGIHPLKAFFACVGGCTGIGNVVAICTAVQIGGPGALFWIWIAAIAGMILKYAEVYLGIRYRITNPNGGYNGGPMFFLKKVFKNSAIPQLVCVLLCIYGVEIYQFSVVTTSLSTNLEIHKGFVIVLLLGLVLSAAMGGVKRVGNICGRLIPLFLICYIGMGAWVLANNFTLIPEVFKQIFVSAFNGHAAVGAFAGSSIMIAISQGIRRGCYAGDVGVGYASVIHSETSLEKPEKQAMLAIFDIFVDSFLICTTSIVLVLITGVWREPLDSTVLVQSALSQYFPYMEYFMPIFLFLLGYTTIIAYFCAGIKCAEHLSPDRGKYYYYLYAIGALLLFSFIDPSQALIIMSITGALLLIINLFGIFHLRHELGYTLHDEDENTHKICE